MKITRASEYTYHSENYSFKADVDEFRTIMSISAILAEVVQHTEGGWIGMNVFCRNVMQNIDGVHFGHDKVQYILALLANEEVTKDGKPFQRGIIKIVQDENSPTKKIMPNGEKGAEILKKRLDNIVNLSQKELAEYEQGGAHREHGNRKAFRAVAEWKTKHDRDGDWLKFMHSVFQG